MGHDNTISDMGTGLEAWYGKVGSWGGQRGEVTGYDWMRRTIEFSIYGPSGDLPEKTGMIDLELFIQWFQEDAEAQPRYGGWQRGTVGPSLVTARPPRERGPSLVEIGATMRAHGDAWVRYVTQDSDGKVTAWQERPEPYGADYNGWLQDTGHSCEVKVIGGATNIPNWPERFVDLGLWDPSELIDGAIVRDHPEHSRPNQADN